MSLDLYFTEELCSHCHHKEEVSFNITHNLNTMADKAGIYNCLWRPEEHGITRAGQMIAALETGLDMLCVNPDKYRKYNSSNGWGLYEHLVEFVIIVLDYCREHPNATVWASR